MVAGEIISCLENSEDLQSVDLNELSVTLDIFVLTLPLEIDVMADFHHNRSVTHKRGLTKFDLCLLMWIILCCFFCIHCIYIYVYIHVYIVYI